jgi:hypothetical protein
MWIFALPAIRCFVPILATCKIVHRFIRLHNSQNVDCSVIVRVTNGDPSAVIMSSCLIKWQLSEWSQTRTITIRAQPTFVDDAQRTITLITEPAQSSSRYSGFNPADITLHTLRRPGKWCSTWQRQYTVSRPLRVLRRPFYHTSDSLIFDECRALHSLIQRGKSLSCDAHAVTSLAHLGNRRLMATNGNLPKQPRLFYTAARR